MRYVVVSWMPHKTTQRILEMKSRDIGERIVYVDVVDGTKMYGVLVAFVGKHDLLVQFDSGRYGIVSEHEISKL